MIAQELEVSLHMAFMDARQKRHEFITVEHLLLALLDNPSASEVLRACAANIEELRKLLTDFINEHTPIVTGDEVDTQPTLGFQRVIQLFFALPRERATQIMLKVHTEGRGVRGIYPKDVASTKVEQVIAYSRQHQHPLQCAMEET